MKLTIIVDDGAVYEDGTSYSGLDMSIVPSGIHALQWEGTQGWVEFKDNSDGTKPNNQLIIELPSWANECLTKRNEAILAEEAANSIPVVDVSA